MFTAIQDGPTQPVIDDRKKIFVRYLKGWFVLDLIAVFPVDEVSELLSGASNSLGSYS